ncbi:Isochorismatase-like protein [Flagelloscypha sp. PMI_526]|nr:Isochorismatase-like protein [Flagelloscypha sp. PMI_526]
MLRALLVIDAQENMLTDPSEGGVPSSQMTRQAIEQILVAARGSASPPTIIHIRNNGGPGEPDEPNTPGWQLVFPPLPTEPVIDKPECNSFKDTNLADLIPASEAWQVVITGLQSDWCVRETALAAKERGNNVALVAGAHTTYDGKTTKAVEIEQKVEHELKEAGVEIVSQETVLSWFSS